MKRYLNYFIIAMVLTFVAFSYLKSSYGAASNIVTNKFFKAHTAKTLYQVPNHPKMWLLLIHNISNEVNFARKFGFKTPKVDVIAYGPAVKIYLKTDKKYYPILQSLSMYGVKFVICHATMVGMHLKKSQIFNFVHVVYPGGVFYITQKEMEGFAYIKP